MTGTFYGVGVGPGDPELITLKAVRILRKVAVVAVPVSDGKKSLALDIAHDLVEGKPILSLDMPMTLDLERLDTSYNAAFKQISQELDVGHSVAFLTLGDPSLYSTFTCLHQRVEAAGYLVEIVPGVPSFCAVAARARMPLAERDEVLTIVPSPYVEGPFPTGNLVFMKVGRHFDRLCQLLDQRLDGAVLVENCGMEGEQVQDPRYRKGPCSYFSTMIVKSGRGQK